MERQAVSKAQKTSSQSSQLQKQPANTPAAQHPLLALQRSIGNQAMQRLIRSPYIQAKLQVGAPGDQYEQEADRVAEEVMRMPAKSASSTGPPSVQRKCTACGTGGGSCPQCAEGQAMVQRKPLSRITSFVQRQAPLESAPRPLEEEERKKDGGLVQRQAVASSDDEAPPEDEATIERQMTESVEGRLSASAGSGEALPEGVRSDMESAMGADFSSVKVHTDLNAVQMNKDLGAKAFTHRNNIYFSPNSYNPSTISGKKLLAHELTHVVQQSGGELQRAPQPQDDKEEEIKRVSKKDVIQRVPAVTDLRGPAEMPAALGRRVTLRATAARGTAINWSITAGAGTGAVLGGGTGLTNTLTAPVGSTGGAVTVQATNAADATDFNPVPYTITLVEVQQPTFAFNPPMPAFAPANTMDASVCGNNATADAVRVPAGRLVTWSIVGNSRGATIDPVTGVITPSVTQTGNIVVRATDNALPAARNQQTLTIRAHPRRISRTQVGTFPMPAAQGGPYGAIYTHTFQSSGGSLNNLFVGENVACGNDPFNACGAAIPIATGALSAQVNAAGQWGDIIGTPSGTPGIDVNRFLPSPPNPGLPQDFSTPQILYWRSDQCSAAPAAGAATAADFWVPFTTVAIHATLLRSGGNFFFRTTDNGVATPLEAYAGPAFAPGAAPAGSVCAPGEGITNITFSPPIIAADGNALTTTAATAVVRPGGNLITWSFPAANNGATIVAPGNPALIGAGNIAGPVRVRAEMTTDAACFGEAFLRMQEVVIGPAIRFSPASVRPGATTRATVATSPGPRIVNWAIIGPALGSVIARNPDNSATITAGGQVGRITIRATDDRDATKFTEASLVIN